MILVSAIGGMQWNDVGLAPSVTHHAPPSLWGVSGRVGTRGPVAARDVLRSEIFPTGYTPYPPRRLSPMVRPRKTAGDLTEAHAPHRSHSAQKKHETKTSPPHRRGPRRQLLTLNLN